MNHIDRDRALDVEIATALFGFDVRPEPAPAGMYDGGWSIGDADEYHWAKANGRHMQPVYVGHCNCDLFIKPVEPFGEDRWQEDFRASVAIWGHDHCCLNVVPEYSTDAAAMMQVVEKMREKGWNVAVEFESHNAHVAATISGPMVYVTLLDKRHGVTQSKWAVTAPEAVCKAALLAIAQTPESAVNDA